MRDHRELTHRDGLRCLRGALRWLTTAPRGPAWHHAVSLVHAAYYSVAADMFRHGAPKKRVPSPHARRGRTREPRFW